MTKEERQEQEDRVYEDAVFLLSVGEHVDRVMHRVGIKKRETLRRIFRSHDDSLANYLRGHG